MPSLSPLVITSYALLLAAIVMLWAPWRFAWVVAFAASIVFGYASGLLVGPAIAPILILAAACAAYHRSDVHTSAALRAALIVIVLLTALGLGLHIYPGFANATVWRDIVFSSQSAPYTLTLGYDKTLAGLLILGLCYGDRLRGRAEWSAMLRRVAPIMMIAIIVVIALALALGFVRVDPKWTSLFWPWAVVNLLFTCVAEEAFFRGLIQRQLDRRLTFPHKAMIAVAASAILFGLAHAAGGPAYVLLSTVAGLGYALAFQRTQRIEAAILTHFALNATHFLLLTYPRVA